MKEREGDSRALSLRTGAPRWVRVFGIIAVVLALLFVVLHLTGHGFGSHAVHGAEFR